MGISRDSLMTVAVEFLFQSVLAAYASDFNDFCGVLSDLKRRSGLTEAVPQRMRVLHTISF